MPPWLWSLLEQYGNNRQPSALMQYCVDLHILIVDPAYQRRGLGTMLLGKGLAEADKARAKTFIEATVPGLPMYLRHGFEEVDAIKIDMGRYGGHGIQIQKRLTRPARNH